MFVAKPFASLSSGLLARKGGARPAMRPSAMVATAAQAAASINEDLGWNDHGAEPAAPLPAVLVQRETLREEIESPPAAEPAEPAIVDPSPATLIRAQRGARGKAAFTLRLEPARHLRLRIASAVRHRSAQQLVTEALDIFLNSLPDVEDLARQCPTPERPGV